MSTKTGGAFRTTYLLMGVFALLLAVLAIYVFFGSDKKPNPDGFLFETFYALKTKPSDITGLEIERGGEKIVFSRQADGRWRMTQPIDARADSDRVETIVNELLAVRRDDKSADLSPNLATHGLDNPAVKLTLRKGDRSEWLALGKTTMGAEKAVAYVIASEDPKTPHATKLSRLSSLFKEKAPDNAGTAAMVPDAGEFRTKKLFGEGMRAEAAPTGLLSVTLTERLPNGRTEVVQVSRQNADHVWRFDKPAGYGDVELEPPAKTVNPNTIYNLSSLLNTILSMEVHETKDFLPNAADLSALGLDPTSPGVLRIDLERNDAIGTETLWLSGNIKTELDKCLVRYGSENSVAQINAEKARILRSFIKDPSTLRESTLVKLRPRAVDAVDITLDKKTIELRKIGGRWKLAAGEKRYDANEEIERLLQKLAQRGEVRGFPRADATDAALGVDNPAVEIKIWEDGIVASDKPDPKEWPKVRPAPTYRLQFGKKDVGDIVFVRRFLGPNRADFKMPVSLLELAAKDRINYVDIALTPFDPENVDKITILKHGETSEIERDKGKLPAAAAEWTILAPPSKKGKRANAAQIDSILRSFAETKVDRVVIENPSKDQLATLGLDPEKPVLMVALRFKDGVAERRFYLGNQVNDKLTVYTKTNLSDYVFEWAHSLGKQELVAKGPLLDPYLYKIEPANVKGIRLRGWVDPAKPGEPQTLAFVRKPDGSWATTGTVAFDPQKLESFMQAVLHPQSTEQVVEANGSKPEHKLDLKEGGLEIEIDVGAAKPVTLTLGGAADKENTRIYAMTNQLSGDVFTLDGARLVPVKEKMEALTGKTSGGDKK